MSQLSEIEEYNYARWSGGDNQGAFRTVAPVGSTPPDFTATLLDTGEPVRLSDYWRERDVLIEFGAIT